MGKLTYSVYAQTIQIGHNKPNMTKTANVLLGVIINDYTVYNSKGVPYSDIAGKEAGQYYRGEADIPDPIKMASNEPSVQEHAAAYFEQEVLKNLIVQAHLPEICAELMKYVQEEPLTGRRLQAFEDMLNAENYAEFLAETFFLAISSPNGPAQMRIDEPKKEMAVYTVSTIEKQVQDALHALSLLPKPIKLRPPQELQDVELPCVNELLRTYSYEKHEAIDSRDKIPSAFRRHFERQRECFYDAESVRQSTRDSDYFSERNDFANLKNEICGGVIELSENPRYQGLERIEKVLTQAGSMSLSSLLPRIPDWIGSNEKKGVCHMLVNDGEIRWIDDDDTV